MVYIKIMTMTGYVYVCVGGKGGGRGRGREMMMMKRRRNNDNLSFNVINLNFSLRVYYTAIMNLAMQTNEPLLPSFFNLSKRCFIRETPKLNTSRPHGHHLFNV